MAGQHASHLEVWGPQGVELSVLSGTRVTVGRREDNDVALPHDRSASGLHAVLEAYGESWCVRDLGSRNGTFVEGEQITTERALRHGDELRIGQTRLVFRTVGARRHDPTVGPEAAPELTRRERDVLVALCRPLLVGAVFREPASIQDMAAELVVTPAAIKQHLANLYDKFGVRDGRRRVTLANEALRRGAVSSADLARSS
jgi:hypothetical protein